MSSPTEEFFADLSRRGYEPLLEKASGTIRFDIAGGPTADRRLVAIDRGDIEVRRDDESPADCVVEADRSVLDEIVSGRRNAMAAVLRGAVTTQGNLGLVVLLQRLLPGQPGSPRHPIAVERGDS